MRCDSYDDEMAHVKHQSLLFDRLSWGPLRGLLEVPLNKLRLINMTLSWYPVKQVLTAAGMNVINPWSATRSTRF